MVRQYVRRLDDQFVLYYDLTDYDETFFYEEELVSGKPVDAKVELERQFDANVVLWGPDGQPKDWDSNAEGAYVDLHQVPGRVERVDQGHVKYFLDLKPGKKQLVRYTVTYKRRKQGPELNTRAKAGTAVRQLTFNIRQEGVKNMRASLFSLGLLLPLALVGPALAAVDLVTLPTREGTQLTIYNSEDITMVREHRLLTVKEGVNRIQFSWANTLIDPTSIEFRILDQQDKVDLVDTTFPAGRNEALQWNIKSQIAGKIPVEIRYFTSGITWAADYVGIANEDETKLNVTGYVRVTNGSGEVYDNAQTRLVVGKINLVEKIADLAEGHRRGC